MPLLLNLSLTACFKAILLIALNALYSNAFSQQAGDTITKPPSRFLCNQKASIGKKLLRAEVISLTLQGAGYLHLIMQPPEKTNWHSKDAGENYSLAFTAPPVWDKDDWFYNYFGHPLTGAVHYNLLRSQDVPAAYSFLYSTAQSVIWEYLIESSQERPSIQDLLLTSTTGSIIGELLYMSTIAMKQNRFTTAEKIIVTLINPMYVINNGYRATQEKNIWWKPKRSL